MGEIKQVQKNCHHIRNGIKILKLQNLTNKTGTLFPNNAYNFVASLFFMQKRRNGKKYSFDFYV